MTTGRRAGSVDRRPRCRCGIARNCRRRLRLSWFRRTRANHTLLADLDGNRFRAPVRKALAHLACFHAFAQLQPAPGTTQSQWPFLLLLSCVGHRAPIPLSCRSRLAGMVLSPRSTTASARKPANFCASKSSRRPSGPDPIDALTTCSRPKAAPSSAAVSTRNSGTPRPRLLEFAASALGPVQRREQ